MAAIFGGRAEAYRRAVDLSPRDYRAWYGLGQTYELLHMPLYALHYFRRATQARACSGTLRLIWHPAPDLVLNFTCRGAPSNMPMTAAGVATGFAIGEYKHIG